MTLSEIVWEIQAKHHQARESETPDPNSLVPGIIVPGLTMLVAKQPRTRITSLSLGLALEVARGGQVFGVELKAHGVIYMAPKAAKARLRGHLEKLLQGAQCPARLEIVFHSSTHLDEQILQELEKRLAANPEIRLVVLEMFPHRKPRNNDPDAGEITKLKSLAARHQLALVVVQDLGQIGSANFYPDWAGSAWIQAVDNLAILERRPYQRGATLRISGRIFKKIEIAFNQVTGRWEVPSPEKQWHLTQAQEEIVAVFREHPGIWDLQLIAALLGKKNTTVSNLLAQLRRAGIIRRVSYGNYALTEYPPAPWEALGRLSKKRRRGVTREEFKAFLKKGLYQIAMLEAKAKKF